MQKRHYAKSIVWTPRLKEMLDPPPPITARQKPKNLPKLEDIKIPKKINREPTDILKVFTRQCIKVCEKLLVTRRMNKCEMLMVSRLWQVRLEGTTRQPTTNFTTTHT